MANMSSLLSTSRSVNAKDGLLISVMTPSIMVLAKQSKQIQLIITQNVFVVTCAMSSSEEELLLTVWLFAGGQTL